MWILPTLNRIKKLETFLKSAHDAGTTTPGLVVVDHDDRAAHMDEYDRLVLPEGWKLMVTVARTMGDKCRELWPEVKDYKWVGLLNDDHFIVTPEWDKKLLQCLDGKNFVSANDRRMFPIKATTATAWSMDLLKALDWPIYPPDLKHLFIDDVWENIGNHTGCWRKCGHVVVEHHHALWGAEVDDTHRSIYGDGFAQGQPGKMWDHDHAAFQNFMKHDFAATVAKVLAFQNRPRGQRFDPNYDKPRVGMMHGG